MTMAKSGITQNEIRHLPGSSRWQIRQKKHFQNSPSSLRIFSNAQKNNCVLLCPTNFSSYV